LSGEFQWAGTEDILIVPGGDDFSKEHSDAGLVGEFSYFN
jgi:hypothetical protein